jgi:glycine/D-amino acid oxidase-like deaminating enzyme
MTRTAEHVIVIGSGIAGASASYFAAKQGARITVIDSGHGKASAVPTALINPVRGQNGKVIPAGAEAARFTFAMIAELIGASFNLPHGRGLWRPVPDATTRSQWEEALAGESGLPHSWHPVPRDLRLSGEWHSALYLPESGWVETSPLLDALLASSKATRVTGHVKDHPVRRGSAVVVTLLDKREFSADRVLWCGGALGAAQNHLGRTTFRAGSVLVVKASIRSEAMSFGLYSAPYQDGAVVGPTSEPRTAKCSEADNPAAVDRLIARATSMWGAAPSVESAFRGVRLEEPPAEPHCESLTGFGGRGYLMAPIAASRWAASL